MTAIIIMIFSVGILTQSMNEINYAQQQIDQIASDELAKGIFWNAYAQGMQNTGNSTSIPLSGRSYNVTFTSAGQDGSNPALTDYTSVANYDTF